MQKVHFIFYTVKDHFIIDENNQEILCKEFCIKSDSKYKTYYYTYYISALGKVWRKKTICEYAFYDYCKFSEILIPIPVDKTRTGFNKVNLQVSSHPFREREYRVDALVLNAFKENKFNKTRAKHLNGIRDDDSLENLIWN